MSDLFRTLVLQGLTLRAIRSELLQAGEDLSSYSDCELIPLMREILQEERCLSQS